MTAVRPNDTRESPSYCATTIQHKKLERAALDARVAAFCAGGGKVQILGNTEWKKPLTRRQAIERRVTKT